jgi:hypothetical protein
VEDSAVLASNVAVVQRIPIGLDRGTRIARDRFACTYKRSSQQEPMMRLSSGHYDDARQTNGAQREEHDLCERVRAEFLEMPGLTLTLPQASRLFSIEPARCERVLGALVDAGDLATDGRAFASPGTGRRYG